MNRKKFLSLLVCLCFVLGLLTHREVSSAAMVVTPHVLTNSSKSDYNKETITDFNSDGDELLTLKVPQNGAVRIRLAAEKNGFFIAEIYKKSDASDLPHFMKTDCTTDLWTTGFMMEYFDKGTYYIRLPKGKYKLGLVEYPCQNLTVTNGTTTAGYCDYEHGCTYTFKAPGNGSITFSNVALENTDGSMTAVLCNAKGKALTESSVFNQTQYNKISYAVKKGATYKLKVKALNVNDTQYYSLQLKYTAIAEKSGSSKKKAVLVKFGNKVSGTVCAEDAKSKADWYMIKNTKKQELLLNYSGNITSGNIILDVYDAKGKKLDSYSVIANISDASDDILHNGNKGTQMPAGTYYIRVTKSGKTASGSYSFSLAGK